MTSPLVGPATHSDDMYAKMVSNLEDRLCGNNEIFQMSFASRDVRIKEQLEEIDKLISKLSATKVKCQKIEKKIDIDTVIEGEIKKMFSFE